MRLLLAVKGDRASAAYILAAVGKTAAACLGNIVAAHRTFIAGNFDNLNNIGIFLIPAHCNLNAFFEYSALLVNAATHCRLIAGNDLFRNIEHMLLKRSVPFLARNLAQNLIL